MYTLKQILEDNSSPPEPIIDNGILLDGTILIIVGPAKSKKTFLTQNLVSCIHQSHICLLQNTSKINIEF